MCNSFTNKCLIHCPIEVTDRTRIVKYEVILRCMSKIGCAYLKRISHTFIKQKTAIFFYQKPEEKEKQYELIVNKIDRSCILLGLNTTNQIQGGIMKKPNNYQILLYLIIAALVAEVVILARQNYIFKHQRGMPAPSDMKKKEITVGIKVPPLTLQNLDGKEFELQFTGSSKKTLLYYFGLSCPQCLNNIPHWSKLTESLKDENSVQLVSVVRDNIDAVKTYVHGYNLRFPVSVLDMQNRVINDAYQIQYVPTTILIDDSSRIIKAEVGVLSESIQQEFINLIQN